MNQIPVVFIHIGNPKYLKKVISLANRYGNAVFLIGDQSNRKICEKWIDSANLKNEKYNLFQQVYQHMSTNAVPFEIGCFRRYFWLQAFMKKWQINECFMIDSDVCIYRNLSQMDLKNYEVACGVVDDGIPNIWYASPHSSYWTVEALDNFIDFLINVYVNRRSVLDTIWMEHVTQNILGGISDMVLLRLWIKEAKPRWKNLAMVDENEFFDDNVNCACNYINQNYQMQKLLFNRKIKKVVFADGRAYMINNHQEKVITNIIHAQGEAKMYISCFTKYRNNILSYYLADIYHESIAWIKTVLDKIIRG